MQKQPAATQPARFSLGAGFGFTVIETGGLGLSSGGSAASARAFTPTGVALFEVAVTRAVRLMLGINGSYTKKLDANTAEPDRSVDAAWVLGGGVGARWVLNPGGVVELSPALLLGVHGGRTHGVHGVAHEKANGQIYETLSEDGAIGFDGRLGLVLEHALLPNLHLRFEAYFLRGGVERSAVQTNGSTNRTARAGLGWGLAPALILRMSL